MGLRNDFCSVDIYVRAMTQPSGDGPDYASEVDISRASRAQGSGRVEEGGGRKREERASSEGADEEERSWSDDVWSSLVPLQPLQHACLGARR
jgi:hypothetical protein